MRPLLLVFEDLARLCIDADFGEVSAALDIEGIAETDAATFTMP